MSQQIYKEKKYKLKIYKFLHILKLAIDVQLLNQSQSIIN